MSGAGTRIAMMLVGFLLTPYILFSLGMVDFGLLAIFGSLAGYLGLLDFGLGGTFVKFITEYAERNELRSARQVITFGTLFYAGFGIAMGIPAFFLAPALVHLFHMPGGQMPHAVNVFREFLVLVIASMIVSIPGAAVVAKHRMDLASRNWFAAYFVYAALVAVLLHLHYGITGVVLAQAAQVAVGTGLQYLTARRLIGPLFIDPRKLDGTIVRRMFTFGGWTQLTSLLNVVIGDAGRFVSASVVSIASVSYYEIGGKLAYIARTLPNNLVDAVSPAAAAADAHADVESLRQIELTGSLYLLLATTLIAGFVVGACDPIVRVWLGVRYPYVVAVTLWIAVGYVLSSGATVGVTMLRSIGKPNLEAVCFAAGAAVNVAATLVLTRMFGVVGAAAGTCVGWAAFALTYCVIAQLRRQASAFTGLFPALRIIGVGAGCSALLAWFVHSPWINGLFATRASGLAALAVSGVLYVAVFGLISWIAGSFRFDQTRIDRNMTRLRRFSAVRLGRVQA